MTIRTGNGVFFCFIAALILATVGLFFLLRHKSEALRRGVLIGLCLLDILVYAVYKIGLSRDAAFLVASGQTSFTWYSELPIQFCNINMFLIPLALLLHKRGLLGFSFFLAPLGALMAMTFPEPAFNGYSLLLGRVMGFYVTHGLLFIISISLATLEFYRPRFRDISVTLLTTGLLASVIHLVNHIMRQTVYLYANYFFTYESGGVGVLEVFWSWIPIPLVYLFSTLVIVLPYVMLVTGGFRLYAYWQIRSHVSEEG